MRIDNSALTKFRFCGLAYQERYEVDVPLSSLQRQCTDGRGFPPPDGECGLPGSGPAPDPRTAKGIVGIAPTPDKDFGSRFHQLVANARRRQSQQPTVQYAPWPDESIELECQATWAQYQAYYATDPHTAPIQRILSVERTEHIALPGTGHELTVRIDAVVGFDDGTIGPLDTKTEKHGSRSNTRESWVGRTQAALYLWACRQLYPQETVSRMVIDVVTRGTAKFPASFRRMDDISQSLAMQEDAIRNAIQVAEEITRHRQDGWWPSNRNSCVEWWGRPCEYYDLHVLGRTDANLRKYRPARDYLADEN